MRIDLPIPAFQLNQQWTSALSKVDVGHHVSGLPVWTFSPDFSIGLNGAALDSLFTELFPDVSNRAKKGINQALQSALVAMAQICRYEGEGQRCAFVHAQSNTISRSPIRYRVCDFSRPTFSNVLKALADKGFLGLQKGFKGKKYAHGLASLWWPSGACKQWLETHNEALEVVQFKKSHEVIKLKDGDGNLIEYSDDSNTKSMRARVVAGNELRQRFKWTYMPLEADARQFALDDKRNVIPRESLNCYRIFHGDFESGGRFYCGAQSLRKAERTTIELDGLSTLELDFKSLHPRFLYNIEGHPAPMDCYASTSSRSRDLTKYISLLSINCHSRKQAASALLSKASDPRSAISSQIDDYEDAERLIDEYVREHPLIAHRFFKSAWQELQHLDSQLVDKLLKAAADLNIPALPIHDSFIVAAKHADWLHDETRKAYKELLGFDSVISWEPMPDLSKILADIDKCLT